MTFCRKKSRGSVASLFNLENSSFKIQMKSNYRYIKIVYFTSDSYNKITNQSQKIFGGEVRGIKKSTFYRVAIGIASVFAQKSSENKKEKKSSLLINVQNLYFCPKFKVKTKKKKAFENQKKAFNFKRSNILVKFL